eukprot:14412967-Ditylum_brightwellii.AAC.1
MDGQKKNSVKHAQPFPAVQDQHGVFHGAKKSNHHSGVASIRPHNNGKHCDSFGMDCCGSAPVGASYFGRAPFRNVWVLQLFQFSGVCCVVMPTCSNGNGYDN